MEVLTVLGPEALEDEMDEGSRIVEDREEMVKDLIERKCIVSTLKKPIRLQLMIEKIEQIMKEKNNNS
jgi:ribosomal protein L17